MCLIVTNNWYQTLNATQAFSWKLIHFFWDIHFYASDSSVFSLAYHVADAAVTRLYVWWTNQDFRCWLFYITRTKKRQLLYVKKLKLNQFEQKILKILNSTGWPGNRKTPTGSSAFVWTQTVFSRFGVLVLSSCS